MKDIYHNFAALVFIVVFNAVALAQQPTLSFDPAAGALSSYSSSDVQNPVLSAGVCDPPETATDNGSQFFSLSGTNNLWGGAHSLIKRGLPNCKVSASGTGNVQIEKNGSSAIYVQWWCHSIAQYDCYDPDCPWFARDTSSLNAKVVIRIGGLPNGAPVTVGYDWKHFSSIANEPEAVDEDNAEVANATLNLFNRTGFGQGLNLAGPTKFAQLRTGDSLQTFNTVAGDSLVIDISALTLAYVFPPPYTPQNPREDDASADFFGFVNVYVSATGSPLPVPVASCPPSSLSFSVDIGGDRELSDPSTDGNEVLDPGDLFMQNSTTALPFFNDSILFSLDPSPNSISAAGTCTPGPLQQWQSVLNFDLDGADRIDYSLLSNLLSYGIGKPSIPYYQTDCIYSPQFAVVSYDEDRGINFSSAVNCNVPSSFTPLDTVMLKGTINGNDEVMYATLSNILGTANFSGIAVPFMNENDLAAVLSPSPASIIDVSANDDVDALDFFSDPAVCGIQYFSVDHEAHYLHKGDTLRSGFIYQYISPDSIQAVIHPLLHLGLSNEVDIDAFEFAWVYDSAAQRKGLALVFSVSVNDPFNPTNYSAGLDPGALYASFLNGTYFELSPALYPGNIDAMTFVCEPLLPPGSVFVTPVTTGFENTQEEIATSVFPNPNNGYFYLDFTMPEKGSVQLNLLTLSGEIAWFSTPNEYSSGKQLVSIPTLQLSSGLYVVELKISSENAKAVIRKKVTVVK